jgi:hypothetical protein
MWENGSLGDVDDLHEFGSEHAHNAARRTYFELEKLHQSSVSDGLVSAGVTGRTIGGDVAA